MRVTSGLHLHGGGAEGGERIGEALGQDCGVTNVRDAATIDEDHASGSDRFRSRMPSATHSEDSRRAENDVIRANTRIAAVSGAGNEPIGTQCGECDSRFELSHAMGVHRAGLGRERARAAKSLKPRARLPVPLGAQACGHRQTEPGILGEGYRSAAFVRLVAHPIPQHCSVRDYLAFDDRPTRQPTPSMRLRLRP